MLKTIMLRKRLQVLQAEETDLRSKQAGFAKREEEIAAQVEAAQTEAEISAAADAVAELEKVQKTTKERLQTIADECAALLKEIEDAEAAAAEAVGGEAPMPDGEEDRSRRSNPAEFQRRCREFQRTGKMTYRNAVSMVKRAALLSSASGVIGPTGVSGINDAQGMAVSDFIDLIKVTDCTGMTGYKVALMTGDAADAAAITEGSAPTESEPTFDSVTLTPTNYGTVGYVSKEIRKQSPLNYEEKVRESARRALRRKLNAVAANAILASTLNTAHALEADKSATKGSVLFDEKLLSNIILAYGGDEGVEGSACLYLNKADLLAFAAIRGKNEYLPVYSITPDAANPSTGIIKDNNGLSCRYCLSKDLTALSTATLTTTATKHMFYGNPQCAELALWGGFEVEVNEGYKFAEGLLTVRGEVTADVDVTVKNGFVVVTAKKAA